MLIRPLLMYNQRCWQNLLPVDELRLQIWQCIWIEIFCRNGTRSISAKSCHLKFPAWCQAPITRDGQDGEERWRALLSRPLAIEVGIPPCYGTLHSAVQTIGRDIHTWATVNSNRCIGEYLVFQITFIKKRGVNETIAKTLFETCFVHLDFLAGLAPIVMEA